MSNVRRYSEIPLKLPAGAVLFMQEGEPRLRIGHGFLTPGFAQRVAAALTMAAEDVCDEARALRVEPLPIPEESRG